MAPLHRVALIMSALSAACATDPANVFDQRNKSDAECPAELPSHWEDSDAEALHLFFNYAKEIHVSDEHLNTYTVSDFLSSLFDRDSDGSVAAWVDHSTGEDASATYHLEVTHAFGAPTVDNTIECISVINHVELTIDEDNRYEWPKWGTFSTADAADAADAAEQAD